MHLLFLVKCNIALCSRGLFLLDFCCCPPSDVGPLLPACSVGSCCLLLMGRCLPALGVKLLACSFPQKGGRWKWIP